MHSEVVNVENLKTTLKSEVKTEMVEPVGKLDTRYFGELLADVYRKNCDVHSCVSEHVAKIRGRYEFFKVSLFVVLSSGDFR